MVSLSVITALSATAGALITWLIIIRKRKINLFNNERVDVIYENNQPWLPAEGIDRQYQNRSANIPFRNPVLQYQMEASYDTVPIAEGDNFRTPTIAGPVDSAVSYIQKLLRPGAPVNAYYPGEGPYVNDNMGVQVPMGSLKAYNERYNPGQFKMPNPHFQGGAPPGVYSGNPYPNAPFYGSVNAYAPFPEIKNPWEKAGILTSVSSDEILNLYRRPIAPLQDLWEYQVEDKNGFIIVLNNKYINDGDIVNHVIGKHNGPWKAHIFVQNKYIWV